MLVSSLFLDKFQGASLGLESPILAAWSFSRSTQMQGVGREGGHKILKWDCPSIFVPRNTQQQSKVNKFAVTQIYGLIPYWEVVPLVPLLIAFHQVLACFVCSDYLALTALKSSTKRHHPQESSLSDPTGFLLPWQPPLSPAARVSWARALQPHLGNGLPGWFDIQPTICCKQAQGAIKH